MKKISLVILVLIIITLAIVLSCYLNYCLVCKIYDSCKVEPVEQVEQSEQAQIFETEVVKVSNIKINEKISSPLMIAGQAVGNWMFEASLPVEITDKNGNRLGISYAQAQGEWMTTDFVPFESTIEFNSGTATSGFIIFHKDNPSGLPEHDDSRQMSVTF